LWTKNEGNNLFVGAIFGGCKKQYSLKWMRRDELPGIYRRKNLRKTRSKIGRNSLSPNS
jgi:hypothetical protein